MLLWDEDDDGGGGVLDFTTKLNQTQKSLGNLEEGTSLKVAGALKNLNKVQDDDGDEDFFNEFGIDDLDEEHPEAAPKRKPSKSICSDASASAVMDEDSSGAGLDIVSRALQGHRLSTVCHTIDEGDEDDSMAQRRKESAQSISMQDKISAQAKNPHHAVATEADSLCAGAARSPLQQYQLCASPLGIFVDVNAFEPASTDAISESLARCTSHQDDSGRIASLEQDNRHTEGEQQDVSPPLVAAAAPQDKLVTAPDPAQQQVSLEEQQGAGTNNADVATDQDQGTNRLSNIQFPGKAQISPPHLPNGQESIAAPDVQEPVQEHNNSALALHSTDSVAPKSPQQMPAPSSGLPSAHCIDSRNTDPAGKDFLQEPSVSKQSTPRRHGAKTVHQEPHGVQRPSSSGQRDSPAEGANEASRSSADLTQQAAGSGSDKAGDKQTAGNVPFTSPEGDSCGEDQPAQKEPVQPISGESSIAKETILTTPTASTREDSPHTLSLPGEQAPSHSAGAPHPIAHGPDQRLSSECNPPEGQTRIDVRAEVSQGGRQYASNDQAAKAPASAQQAASSPSVSLPQTVISSLVRQSPPGDTGGISRHIGTAAFHATSITAASVQPSNERPVPQTLLELLPPPQQPVLSQPSLLIQFEGNQTRGAPPQVNPDSSRAVVPRPAQPLSSGPVAQQVAAKGTQPAALGELLAQRAPAAVHRLPARSPAPFSPQSIIGLTQRSSPVNTSSPIITPFSGRSTMSPLGSSGNPPRSGHPRPLRTAGTIPASRQAPQQYFKKPPLAPMQRAASAARPTIAQRPANPIPFTQSAAQQVLQGSARPPALIQRPSSSQQQPGTSQSPDCSRLAQTSVPQLPQRTGLTPASRAPGPSQQSALTAGAMPSTASTPSAREVRGSKGSSAFGDIAASGVAPLLADQVEGEGGCQPAKRQRVGDHEGNGESSGSGVETRVLEATLSPRVQVPSRAAEAVNLTASLDKMLLEAEKLFDHVMELKVETAIASNRLIRLDNPIVNCNMASLHQQLLAVMNDSEQ